MPEMTDKQIAIIFKNTAWRCNLWNKAVDEMRKRGISPTKAKELYAGK